MTNYFYLANSRSATSFLLAFKWSIANNGIRVQNFVTFVGNEWARPCVGYIWIFAHCSKFGVKVDSSVAKFVAILECDFVLVVSINIIPIGNDIGNGTLKFNHSRLTSTWHVDNAFPVAWQKGYKIWIFDKNVICLAPLDILTKIWIFNQRLNFLYKNHGFLCKIWIFNQLGVFNQNFDV